MSLPRLQKCPTKTTERGAHFKDESIRSEVVCTVEDHDQGIANQRQPVMDIEQNVELLVIYVHDEKHRAFKYEETNGNCQCKVARR